MTARSMKTTSKGSRSNAATPTRRSGAARPRQPSPSPPATSRRASAGSQISLDPWSPVGPAGDPSVHLIARARVGAVPLIAEAIAVETKDGGIQAAVDHSVETRLDELWEAFGIDGPAETVAINNREYLVFVAPAG